MWLRATNRHCIPAERGELKREVETQLQICIVIYRNIFAVACITFASSTQSQRTGVTSLLPLLTMGSHYKVLSWYLGTSHAGKQQ